eukprot:75297-Chlamydomonas_euryale.AAC.9
MGGSYGGCARQDLRASDPTRGAQPPGEGEGSSEAALRHHRSRRPRAQIGKCDRLGSVTCLRKASCFLTASRGGGWWQGVVAAPYNPGTARAAACNAPDASPRLRPASVTARRCQACAHAHAQNQRTGAMHGMQAIRPPLAAKLSHVPCLAEPPSARLAGCWQARGEAHSRYACPGVVAKRPCWKLRAVQRTLGDSESVGRCWRLRATLRVWGGAEGFGRH